MYARNARLDACYEQGLADEKKVIEFLKTQGYEVEPSNKSDNKSRDIDCWVNGKSVSIKSQHKGVNFKNIGFELCNHLTSKADCKITQEILEKPELSLRHVYALMESGSWEPGWFTTGQADNYLFYQGNNLRLYRKESIKHFVESQGFLRIRSLTEDCRSYLGGRYRHCNTICGYLDWSMVIHKRWNLDS